MKILVKARGPYDFGLSCMIFSNGDPKIRNYDDEKFWQVLRVNSKLVYINVKSSGSVDEPVLIVELKSDSVISVEDRILIESIVSNIFNTDFNLKLFYSAVKNDEVMLRLSEELFGLKTPVTPTVFEALIDSIVEQQISLKAAHSIERRIIKTLGSALKIDGHVYYAYPTPMQIYNAPLSELRECGLSFRKGEYIRDLSKLIVSGELDLEKFREYRDIDDVISELCEIRGIGKWTAELTVLRGLNGLDSFPADDIGIRRAVSHYYCNDKRITSDDAREIAGKWGDWKGLAAFYLVIAEILNI